MFKTLSLLIGCFLINGYLFSQELVPNEKLVGINASFWHFKTDEQVPDFYWDTIRFPSYRREANKREIAFSFQSARMVSKKWLLGVGLNGEFERRSGKNTQENGSVSVYAYREAVLRPYCFIQYFKPINKRFLLSGKFQTLLELTAEGGTILSAPQLYDQRLTLDGITADLRLAPAFIYLLHPRVMVELELGRIDWYRDVKGKRFWLDANVRPSWSNLRLWFRFDKKTPPQ